MIARKRLLAAFAVAAVMIPVLMVLPPQTNVFGDTDPCDACPDSCSFNAAGIWGCWGGTELPGRPTSTPVNTLSAPQRTSWAATVDARATLGIEATQTRLAGEGGYVCFSCYATGECSSGWGEACFYNEGLKGYLYPVSLTCQAASECEPTGGPTEPECVPGSAWTPEVTLLK